LSWRVAPRSMSLSSAARSAESSRALLDSLLTFLRGGMRFDLSKTLSNMRLRDMPGLTQSNISRGCIANFTRQLSAISGNCTIRPPSTCKHIQSVHSPLLVSASCPKSCQRLCSVGRNSVRYTRGGSFSFGAGGAVDCEREEGVLSFAFCEGVMKGPPRDDVLTGCPFGR